LLSDELYGTSIVRGVARNLLRGGTRVVWGTEVPQHPAGSRGRASVSSVMLNIRLNEAIDRYKSRTVQSLIIFKKISSYDEGTCPPLATPLNIVNKIRPF